MLERRWVSGPLMAAVCTLAAAGSLRGRVEDIGVNDPGKAGVVAVSVVVSDSAGKELARTTTDQAGWYTVQVPDPQPSRLRAVFRRIGYFADPVLRDLDGPSPTQRVVLLSRHGLDATYYRQVATRAAAEVKGGSWVASDVATSVSSLPPGERQQVSVALKDAGAVSLAANVEQAERIVRISADIQARLAQQKDADLSDIRVHPNYPAVGSMVMLGHVRDRQASRSASDIAGAAKGPATIANEIRVNPNWAAIGHARLPGGVD